MRDESICGDLHQFGTRTISTGWSCGSRNHIPQCVGAAPTLRQEKVTDTGLEYVLGTLF